MGHGVGQGRNLVQDDEEIVGGMIRAEIRADLEKLGARDRARGVNLNAITRSEGVVYSSGTPAIINPSVYTSERNLRC
jgi:hypothetical protein